MDDTCKNGPVEQGESIIQEEETDTRRNRRKRQATRVDDPVGLDG